MPETPWNKELAEPLTAPTISALPALTLPSITNPTPSSVREPRQAAFLREAPVSPDYMAGYRNGMAGVMPPDQFTQSYAEGYTFAVCVKGNVPADLVFLNSVRTDVSGATALLLEDFKAVREADIASSQGGLLKDV